MILDDSRENLIIHIEGLQATLAKRKARIEELEKQLDKQMKSERAEAMKSKAYKQGWKDCAENMKGIAQDVARNLRKIDEGAFRLYLEGEKL